MKRDLSPLLSVVFSLACLFILINFVGPLPIGTAQFDCCTPPPLPINTSKWAMNSTVTVTIDNRPGTGFTEVERQAIQVAFEDFNAAKLEDCTNVNFVGFQFSSTPPSSLQVDRFWITYEDVFSNNIAATSYSSILIPPSNHNITRAVTVFFKNFTVGDPAFHLNLVRSVMRHEIGHTFFLNDKNDCPSSQST